MATRALPGIVSGMAATVLVVDDHPIVRDGVRLLLQQRPEIGQVVEASTTAEALEQAERLQPELILLDITLGDENALNALPALREAAPGTRVLVLSIHDDPSYVRQALAAGASAYIVKEAADRELLDALSTVEAGGRYIEPQLAAKVVEADERERTEHENDTLTPREHDVLNLLALGHTNAEVATRLSLSTRTVETHRSQLMHKLGLTTRAQLIQHAARQGLLNTTGN